MSIWQDKTVLVTGAAGFIGSHLTEALLSSGAKVRALVRYTSTNNIGYLTQIPVDLRANLNIVAGDLRDWHAVERGVAGTTYVFHLGAVISIPYSYQHPVETVSTNLVGTMNVLNACRKHAVTRLIHTSTSEVYGTARYTPIDESHPLQTQSPYAASKAGADLLVDSYYRSYDVPAITVRPFNTYGPRQSTRAVIPTIITQALTQEHIFLGNLEAQRDFTFVKDTVAGFLCAAVSAEAELGQVYNLGTGTTITIGDIARNIIRLLDSPATIKSDSSRLRPSKSEVMLLRSDNRLAYQSLKWQPTTSLTDGLLATIDWVRTNIAQFRVGEYVI